jgi:hypothetical protein
MRQQTKKRLRIYTQPLLKPSVKLLRAFRSVVNHQTVSKQENQQGNNPETECKLVFGFKRVDTAPSDEKSENQHEEIKQNDFHVYDNSFTKMTQTGNTMAISII